MAKEQIVYKKVNELHLNEKNPRKNDNAVDAVAKSIEKYGFKNPLIVDSNGKIWCGNTRFKASKKLGLKEVPCIVADDLTEEQIREYALLDNKTNELAEWDYDLLGEELGELDLSDFDLDWGIGEPEEEKETKEIIEGDVEIDNVPKRVEKGDIWKLGKHYLGCGDSTDFLWLKTLMQGKKADLIFTDPPYGMKKEKDGVANDNLNYDDLLKFNKQWIPHTFDLTKDNGSWYCWGIDEPLMDIYSHILKPMIKENKITFRNLITWDKGNGQGQLSNEYMMYAIADEKCLFVVKGITCLTLNADQYWEEYEPIRLYLYNERIKCGWDIPTMKTIAGHSDKSRDHWTGKSQWNLPTKDVYYKFQKWAKEHKIQAFEKSYNELRAEYEKLRAYFDNTHDNMNNVWHFDRTGKEERELAGGHATPKPIALCARAIKSSSRENEIVLDVFGGSGSTIIACEQLNRICYCNELEPHWCDVIINRWEQFTGKKAIKLN